MKIERIQKESFSVIGKEGSTLEGEGFVQRLWAEANANFAQVEGLAKRDEQGNLVGIWGAMSDFSRSFLPWTAFKSGLYLAGVECQDDADAPSGWVKWTIPGFEYLRAECEENDTFSKVLEYMKENNISLAGAVHDFTSPQDGKNYMCFPICRL